MAEYIEREAVLADELTHCLPYSVGKAAGRVVVFAEDIEAIPAADVVPVRRGKWILHRNGSGTCDQCHFTQYYVWDFDNWQNFCGHCGADMRGERYATD